MSLHLVFSSAGWLACRNRAQPEDRIVLLGDGVYASDSELPAGVCLLGEDLEIRGMHPTAKADIIDYTALVALCVEHHPVVSWNR